MLDGFFPDGMSTDSNRLAYFQEIYSLRAEQGSYKVIEQPGTYPAAAYASANSGTGVADVLGHVCWQRCCLPSH